MTKLFKTKDVGAKKIRIDILTGVALSLLSALAFPLAHAAELVPHEAKYTLKVTSILRDSNVINVNGVMSYRLIDACEGWVLERDTQLNVTLLMGEVSTPSEIQYTYRAFEGHDGKSYDFVFSQKIGGEITEQREGRVDRNSPSSPTLADMSGQTPDGPLEAAELPGGTLFPVASVKTFLDEIAAGVHKTQTLFYDGVEYDGLWTVTSTVHAQRPSTAKPRFATSPLLSDQVWDVTLAYFRPREDLPNFEVSYGLHPSSVAERVVLYGEETTMTMVLEELRPLSGGC